VGSYVMIVQTEPNEGQDEEYNRWYNEQHLSDVLKVKGFVAARRYRMLDLDPPQEGSLKYICIYEIETDDIDAAQQALLDAGKDGLLIRTDALSTGRKCYYEAIGERQVEQDAP
jgi:hypothetical protein